MTAMLTLADLHVHYGKSHALQGINLEVTKGEVVALLGPNGAGKTTTLAAISGLVRPSKGRIEFRGNNITVAAPDRIVEMGLVHVPQGRRIFPQMTVLENLEMGAFIRKNKNDLAEDYEKVYRFFPILRERRKQLAGTLSGGEQQMLAVGRSLMSRPKLLMMDEPSMGLAPFAVVELYDKIREINLAGVTILLVEQNALMALEVATRAYFLETGKISPGHHTKDLMDSDIVKAYLS